MTNTKYYYHACLILWTVVCLPFNSLPAQSQWIGPVSPAATTADIQDLTGRIARMYHADTLVVESFIKAAIKYELQNGISSTVVIAIAIHESSFNSYLFSNTNNPFGIKAGTTWKGRTFAKEHDGEETQFRVYRTANEAVADLGYFIKSRKWYDDAMACQMSDYQCVINGLKKSAKEPGYSLDPNWDEGVMEIIRKFGLQDLAHR